MATEEQTTLDGHFATVYGGAGAGQRLTISNRVVTKLAFPLEKIGTPGSGNVAYHIKRVSDNSDLAYKVQGNVTAIPDSVTWLEVTFATPVYINEEVRLLVINYGSGGPGNGLGIHAHWTSDIKAGEYFFTRSAVGVYTDYPVLGYDDGYIYTYETPATPTVTTQAVTAISGAIATGNGNITSLGAPNPTAHGVCWNTTGAPTTADNVKDVGAASATGAFTAAMTSLTAGTKYHVRAYAYNGYATSYGNEVVFWADKGTVFPSDAVARVSSIRHIYQPGLFRMQVGEGDLGFDIDVAEASVRGALDTAKEVEEAPPEPVVTAPPAPRAAAAPPPPPPPAPAAPARPDISRMLLHLPPEPAAPTAPTAPARLTEYAKKIGETPAAKALRARIEGRRAGVEAVVTPYAIDVLRQKEQSAKLLTELQRVQKAASAPGITSYARQVLIKRAIELKQQLEASYRR